MQSLEYEKSERGREHEELSRKKTEQGREIETLGSTSTPANRSGAKTTMRTEIMREDSGAKIERTALGRDYIQKVMAWEGRQKTT